MIFISHNSKDKPIVEPIAIRLGKIYGINNVFYDSWSIQPGEGIIEKMDEGLTNAKLFIYFVSKNSLRSNMVKLEWQSAIMRMTSEQIKFIPVRLDNCIMPTILMQSLYIDLYQNGIESTIRQIVDVVSGKNTFTPQFENISNLIANKFYQGKDLIIECAAQYYMEPIPNFIFFTSNLEEDISYNCVDSSMFTGGFNERNNPLLLDGVERFIHIKFPQSIIPGYPQLLRVTPTRNVKVDVYSVMHEKQKNYWERIPLFDK